MAEQEPMTQEPTRTQQQQPSRAPIRRAPSRALVPQAPRAAGRAGSVGSAGAANWL